MMNGPRSSELRHWRAVVVPAAIAAGVVGLASVAWACVPGTDVRTLVRSCAAPGGSASACKTPTGRPSFPNATVVQGPAGSSILAYVKGPGMRTGMPYDLVFIGKPLVANRTPCWSSATVISTSPAVGTTNDGINITAGKIPADAPLGGGQVCFTDTTRRLSSSDPAIFKVIV